MERGKDLYQTENNYQQTQQTTPTRTDRKLWPYDQQGSCVEEGGVGGVKGVGGVGVVGRVGGVGGVEGVGEMRVK